MGSESLFGKLGKILKKPQAPAHQQQSGYGVIVPWHQRLWNTIRPPSAAPQQGAKMSQKQRRILRTTAAILIPALAAWGIYDYISSAPQRAQASFDAGMKFIGPGDFTGAVAKFTESISTAETAPARLERGNSYEKLGQPDQALSDWARAIELDPTLADAFTARATYYRVKGDYTKALPDLNRSVELKPTVDGYFQRGQVYAALGQHDKAIEDYDRSILERKEAPYVYLARSISRRARGDEEGYRQDQQAAAKIMNGLH
jgi:tetratricopeptide (TPR) repeat protein